MKRHFTFSHLKSVLSAVLLLAASTANAQFVHIPIPTTGPNGYNADVIVDGVNPSATPNKDRVDSSTTHAFDPLNQWNLVSMGYQRCNDASNTACDPLLPAMTPTGIIPSSSDPALSWQLGAYHGINGTRSNNSIRMTGAMTYSIAVPNNEIGDVYILGTSAGGTVNTTITLKFVGGTTQVYTGQQFKDWMDPNGTPYEQIIGSRVSRSTGLGDPNLGGAYPRVYTAKLTLPFPQYTKQIDSIIIQKQTAGPILHILAVTINHQPCLPIQVTPTVINASIGLTSADIIFSPPTSLVTPYVPPLQYEWVVTEAPNTTPPPNPVVGSSFHTPSGNSPDTILATGLPNGKTLYFHVRSVCAASATSLWRTVSFTTKTCFPPTGVSANPFNMTSATINLTLPAQSQPVTAPLVNQSTGYEWTVNTSATPPPSAPLTSITPTSAVYTPPAGTNTVAGLPAATQHWIHVRKQCASGTTYSNWTTSTFTTLPCPTTPGVSLAGPTTTVSGTVKWNLPPVSSNPSIGYEWQITQSATAPTTPGTPVMLPIPNPPGPFTPPLAYQMQINNLIPQIQYYVWVRNICSGGFYSNWISTPLLTQNCPNTVISVADIVNNTPGAITMKWKGITIPGHHEYHYALQIASAPAPTAWATTNDTFVVLPNASFPVYPGVAYKFWVRGNCTITNAPWLQVPVTNPFPPCLSPLSTGVSNVNMHGATINWTTGFNGIGYQYFISTSPNPPANGSYTTDTFHLATNLLPGVKYYAHVRTHCNTTPVGPVLHNYSPWIKDSFITPAVCLQPVAPTVTNVTAHSAEISWNYYPGMYGYEYFMSKDPNPPLNGLPILYNGYNPLNLHSGTQYWFHLRSRCDTTNYSPWVSTPINTPALCVSAAPTPSVFNIGSTEASFIWSDNADAMNYEYAVTTSAATPGTTAFLTDTTYKAVNLLPNTPYWFHLRTNCSPDDNTSWVSVPFITFTVGVGSMNGNSKFGLDVHPNPVTDVLYVSISGMNGSSARMQLVDMSGKVVETITATSDKVQINMSKLATGMYLLKYVDSENAGVIRIEKQ